MNVLVLWKKYMTLKSIAQISDECDETKERMLGLMKKL